MKKFYIFEINRNASCTKYGSGAKMSDLLFRSNKLGIYAATKSKETARLFENQRNMDLFIPSTICAEDIVLEDGLMLDEIPLHSRKHKYVVAATASEWIAIRESIDNMMDEIHTYYKNACYPPDDFPVNEDDYYKIIMRLTKDLIAPNDIKDENSLLNHFNTYKIYMKLYGFTFI